MFRHRYFKVNVFLDKNFAKYDITFKVKTIWADATKADGLTLWTVKNNLCAYSL